MSYTGAYSTQPPSAGPPLREEGQQAAATQAQPPTTIQIPEYNAEENEQKGRLGEKKPSRNRGEMKIRVDPRSHSAAASPKSPKSPTRAKFARKATDGTAAKSARGTPQGRRQSLSTNEHSSVVHHAESVQPKVGYEYHPPPQTPSYATFARLPTLPPISTPEGSMLFTGTAGHLACPVPAGDLYNPRPQSHGTPAGSLWVNPAIQKQVRLHSYLSPQDVSPGYPSAPSPTPSAVSASSYTSSSTSSSGYSHLGFTRISSPWSPPPSPTPDFSPSTPYMLTPQALRYKPLEEHDRLPSSQFGAQGPVDAVHGLRQRSALSPERPRYPSVKFQVKGGSQPGVRVDKVVGALYDPILENGDMTPFEIYNFVKVHYTWPGYDTHAKRVSTLNKTITTQQIMLAVCTEFHKWATSKAVKSANHQHPGWALGSDVDPMNVFVTELVHLEGMDWQLVCTLGPPRQH